MEPILFLGLVAGALTSLAPLPQLIKSIKTKETKDLSLVMFSAITVGVALWVIYAFFTKDVPLIIANIITLAITAPVLILKIRYK